MQIPESYYRIFDRRCFFIHRITMLTPTEEEDTYQESTPIALKVNINLN